MTRKTYEGGGAAYYVGCGFCKELAQALLDTLHAARPFDAYVRCPADLELCVRRKENTRFLFLLNYTGREQKAELRKPLFDRLAGTVREGEIVIPPFGVAVFCAEA